MIVSNGIYTPNDFTHIRQLPKKILQDYAIRFEKDYHRYDRANEKIVYAALMGGFRFRVVLVQNHARPAWLFQSSHV
jgi:hypothetical protein